MKFYSELARDSLSSSRVITVAQLVQFRVSRDALGGRGIGFGARHLCWPSVIELLDSNLAATATSTTQQKTSGLLFCPSRPRDEVDDPSAVAATIKPHLYFRFIAF
ncbi:MAG: hypothetical protein JO266_08450 [Acidobacteria bacterium]|nr:hypothetical protein [Acidobacteriota bacterium]